MSVLPGRYLALPFEDYPLPSFAAANDAWLRVAAPAANRQDHR
jgi:hypothetical protein